MKFKNLLVNIFVTVCIVSAIYDTLSDSKAVHATMMWVGIAGVATSAVGAGASIYSARQSRKDSQRALDLQSGMSSSAYNNQKQWMDYFKEAIGAFSGQATALANESKTEVGGSYRRGNKYINAIPEVMDLMGGSEKLSRQDFDFRTGLKRENLDFVLGDNEKALRDAQTLNTNIAALNSSDFEGKFSDIVKSSMFGLKADTLGDPLGTFSNLSARNLYDFSQQGLSSALAINDFFSREGTVDPISPLQTAFDLRNIAEREANMRVQNEQWRASSIGQINSNLTSALGTALGAQGQLAQMGIGLESNNLANMSNLSNANLVSAQAQRQSYIDAIGMISSGFGQAAGLTMQAQSVNSQTRLNNQMITQMMNQGTNNRYGSEARTVSMRPTGVPSAY